MQGTTKESTVSAETADWSREHKSFAAWSPSHSLLASIRMYQRHAGRGPIHAAMRRVATLRHRFWSVVSGADIPSTCRLGGGLMLPHPNGIVIHPLVEVGPNCLIFQQVTIGAGGGSRRGVPKVGGHVDIGAGAKILGGITIGDNARIGANAVVTIDVPAGATAMGIPARIVTKGAPPLE
jgi:serine O-acetyltransferase